MDKNRFSVTRVDGERNYSTFNNHTNFNSANLNGGPTSIITLPLQSNKLSSSESLDASSTTWLHDAGWRRKRSLAQLTREALPRLDNYRNSKRALKRPSLGELHGDVRDHSVETSTDLDTKSQTTAPEHVGIKLGWIQGVLIPCLLNIWGVMLFLRLSWVVAQAGVGESLLIILISAIVCVITTLSLSAISTNGEVKGGGIYYIISRSLGPEFGASVGIVMAFANAVSASMNTIGFCNSLNDLLGNSGLKIIDGGSNDVRIVGTIALLFMCMICAIGMEWESKAQNFLIAIIVGAILDFLVGASVGPMSDEQKAKGFTGFNMTVMDSNWYPDFRYSEGHMHDFFSVFSIFFPSVTGIQAGANISGDLKDPASSIPKGTMLALLLSMISYAIFIIFAGFTAMRDASGSILDLANGTLSSCMPNCTYGLHNSYSVMQLMSSWGPFIYAGCFAATLSTALTNLLSVPRLIQALGVDRIYPGLIFFSKGYGKSGEPYRGYVLTFFISTLFVLIADLNTIAPLISNFYLASYALVNFCTFHAALIKPLGWRPTFRYYNVWVSLFGFVMCVAIMFLISWMTSLITFVVFFTLYLIVMYRKPDVNWGSSTQAQTYKAALGSAHRLTSTGEHVKNYRPQLLVLAGPAASRPALVDLASLITKAGSLMIVGNISQKQLSHRERSSLTRSGNEFLRTRKIRAFVSSVDGVGFEAGAKSLTQASGLGRLAPNLLMMGYKQDWSSCHWEDLNAYFNVLHNAFDNRMAVMILRLSGGLDFSGLMSGNGIGNGGLNGGAASGELTLIRPHQMMHADSNLDIVHIVHPDNSSNTNSVTPSQAKAFTITEGHHINRIKKRGLRDQIVYHTMGGMEISKEVLKNISVFRNKQIGGTVDVWWLYDDGGLTILIPYILSNRTHWSNCKLRIFALTNRKHEMELEERNMANLLSKFRIDYSSLVMVQEITDKPKESTIHFFNTLIENFKESNTSNAECQITNTELITLQEKTYRQLRLRELLLQNSAESSLIVMSLPMPRKGSVSAPLYMAWLEILSRDMPPYLFIRGNQSSVLTFYS